MATPKKTSPNQPNPQKGADDIGYWQQIIAQQKESGLNQVNFAKERHISLRKFKRWKNQLEPTKPLPQSSKRQASGKYQASSITGPTKASGSPAAVGNYIELRHQSGFTLVYDAKTQEGLLKKVLKALSELGND